MKLYKCRYVLIGGGENRCYIRRVRFIEPDTKYGHYLYHPVTGKPEDQNAGKLNDDWRPWALLAAFLKSKDCFAHSRRDDARCIRVGGINLEGEELTASLGGLNGYALSHNEIEMELPLGRKPRNIPVPPTLEETDVPWDGHVDQGGG